MFENINNSIAAFCSGFLITLIGHPLDTFKTWKQSNMVHKLDINFTNLYKGIKYPLMQNSIMNSITFTTNEYVKTKTNNIYVPNLCTGAIASIIICPFDKFKIMSQQKLFYPLNMKNIFYSYKDIGIVSMRKLPGIFIYFSTYQKLKKENVPIFLSGSLAGTFSWFCTYPIDVIKTRIQNESCKTIKEAFLKGNLSNGMGICLIRAFIANGVNFTIYEKSLKMLNNTSSIV